MKLMRTPTMSEDRVGVRKRETFKTPEGGYIGNEFWVEKSRPQGVTVEEAFALIEGTIDQALNRAREKTRPSLATQPSTPVTPPPPPVAQPSSQFSAQTSPQTQFVLDPSLIDKAQWTPHSTGRGEWVLAEKIPELRDFLARADKKTEVLGGHRYKLWGDEVQRISRWGKAKEAKAA